MVHTCFAVISVICGIITHVLGFRKISNWTRSSTNASAVPFGKESQPNMVVLR